MVFNHLMIHSLDLVTPRRPPPLRFPLLALLLPRDRGASDGRRRDGVSAGPVEPALQTQMQLAYLPNLGMLLDLLAWTATTLLKKTSAV